MEGRSLPQGQGKKEEGKELSMTDAQKIQIRRQWNDWRIAEVSFDKIEGLRWDKLSGGVRAPAPQPFIHGYVSCADVDGDLAHSCRHGEGPHNIKVCIVKKDNSTEIWKKLLSIVGPKPTC